MAHATCFVLICVLAAASAFAQQRRYRVACFEAFPQFAVARHLLAVSARHVPPSSRTGLVVSIGLIAVAVAARDWPRQIAVAVGVIVACGIGWRLPTIDMAAQSC
jgi:hypothetical protein